MFMKSGELFTLPNYEVLTSVYQGAHSIAYLGRRQKDGVKVFLKTHPGQYPDLRERNALKHEFNFLGKIHDPLIIKPLELIEVQNRTVLVLEYFEGISVKDWLQSNVCQIPQFLTLAIQLAKMLKVIEALQIIHKDIKPSNMLIHPKTLELKLIDFGLSTEVSLQTVSQTDPNLLEGTLAYFSPEQTGRINRSIDYRTDLYSLGVSLYEIITGVLPFQSEDPLELIYWHIARTPQPPHLVKSNIPEVISSIILKLMEKAPENRYQSAHGLLRDLEKCEERVDAGQQLISFPLGEEDIRTTLNISQKLFGRDAEIKKFFEQFEELCRKGKSQVFLVAGAPGIGKTAFIQEIYKPLSEHKGHFLKGRFDFTKKNIAYEAVIEAFSELIEEVLTWPSQKISQVKEQIKEVVGPNGQLLIQIFPKLERIIGPQLSSADLAPTEARNRFHLLFSRFVKIFAKQSHPIVLFIDDLQWADTASIDLIQQILNDVDFLMVILSYRDNEMANIEGALLALDHLRERGIQVNKINLLPLDRQSLVELIRDALQMEAVEPLVEVVAQKTFNNPFFIIQFLKTIYKNGELRITPEGKWEWDLEAINRQEAALNVIDLTIKNLREFPMATEKLLALGACFGKVFSLNSLAAISGISLKKIASDLHQVIQSRLIVPHNPAKYFIDLDEEDLKKADLYYVFLHDKVQEAAYALISKDRKKEIHLKIGRLLLDSTEVSNQNLMDCLHHLNFSSDLITDPLEIERVLELNIRAGKLSREAAAFSAALQYYQKAGSFFPPDSWNSNYEKTFDLFKNLAECLYMTGHVEESKKYIKELIDHAKTNMEKVAAYRILINLYVTRDCHEEALKAGIETLSLLGIKIAQEPSVLNLIRRFLGVQLKLLRKTDHQLMNLPPKTDARWITIDEILFELSVSAYLKMNFFSALSLIALSSTLDHGYSPGSIPGFMLYFAFLTKIRCYERAEVWANMIEKYGNQMPSVGYCIQLTKGLVIYPTRPHHPHDSLPLFTETLQSAMNRGNVIYMVYARVLEGVFKMSCGMPFASIEESFQDALRILQTLSTKEVQSFCEFFIYSNRCLAGSEEWKESLAEEYAQLTIEHANPSTLILYYNHLSLVRLILGDAPAALQAAESGSKFLMYGTVSSVYEAHLNHALAIAANYTSFDGAEKKERWKQLLKLENQVKLVASRNPISFSTGYLMILAEIARLEGRVLQAMHLYDEAIGAAKAAEFIHLAALASEYAFRFYQELNLEKNGRNYLTDAYHQYATWQALGKTRKMEQIDPFLKSPSMFLSVSSGSSSFAEASVHASQNLDLSTIVKANRAISSEIVLPKLLDQLMKILMENAGAQRGVLVFEKNGDYYIQAESRLDWESPEVVSQKANSHMLPTSILSYVFNSKEPLELSNASKSRFSQDLYVKEKSIASVLCLPIINKQKISFVLYLENNAVKGAFTENRIRLIDSLAQQAAVSLDNARVYEATGRFVPSEFIKLLGKISIVDVQLGDFILCPNMTVLFCDIRDFTHRVESMSAQEAFMFVNEFLGVLQPVVQKYGGFIDKYIGDAIMALFVDTADQAIYAAKEMLAEIDTWNGKRFIEGKDPVYVGVGINTGEVVLGILGAENRLEGSVIGDTVNIASRLEHLAKVYKTPILITSNTYEYVNDSLKKKLVEIGEVFVRGRNNPIKVYKFFEEERYGD